MFNFNNLEKSQYGFAIGVRYRPNFAIQDSYGAIVEKLLYSKQTYFTPQRFPQVLANQDERVLFNPVSKNRLIINATNIILDIADKNDISEENAIKCFGKLVIKEILSEFRVKGINRLGLVHRYSITDNSFSKSFRGRIVNDNEKSINNINLQFTQKTPIVEAKSKKTISDYYNTIYTISDGSELNSSQISVDFQRIFVPPIESSDSSEYEKFIAAAKINMNRAGSFLNENFGNKLNGKE